MFQPSSIPPAAHAELPAQPRWDHPHPCNFRLTRVLDRGWGEMAFEYQWDAAVGSTTAGSAKAVDASELTACFLYEFTSYYSNIGTEDNGTYCPPDPPFAGWRFRNPTDGRTAPVALGCFPAAQGWAWDRHKLGGRLVLPPAPSGTSDMAEQAYMITALQQYRFQCQVCGLDAPIHGTASGPHAIIRTFAPLSPASTARESLLNSRKDASPTHPLWRYSLQKHGCTAFLDVNGNGYVDDSAHLGFGPWQQQDEI